MSAQLLEVSLLGVGAVLRLERDAWSMVKWLRQATNEYAPPPREIWVSSRCIHCIRLERESEETPPERYG